MQGGGGAHLVVANMSPRLTLQRWTLLSGAAWSARGHPCLPHYGLAGAAAAAIDMPVRGVFTFCCSDWLPLLMSSVIQVCGE